MLPTVTLFSKGEGLIILCLSTRLVLAFPLSFTVVTVLPDDNCLDWCLVAARVGAARLRKLGVWRDGTTPCFVVCHNNCFLAQFLFLGDNYTVLRHS